MREINTEPADLLHLEQYLRSRMKPVQPDQKFIGALRNQLEQAATQSQTHRLAAMFLTIAGGLLLGLVIYLIGRRFIRQEDV